MVIRKKAINSSLIATTVALLLNAPIVSAIVIDDQVDADGIASALLVNGSGITINSASLSGGVEGYGGYGGEGFDLSAVSDLVAPLALVGDEPLGQFGLFTNASGTYGIPAQGGIVLSTGNVTDYGDGPNNESGNSTDFGMQATAEQNDLLDDLTGQSQHFDPVELNITFTVDGTEPTTIAFFAVFGSEEFPEFVGDSFIDGFGMFVNGENIAGALPTGSTPGVDPLLPININHPDMTNIAGTELDGVLAPNGNPLLRFDAPVLPGENTFTLILADAADNILDTTIFLSSFGEVGESEFIPILPDPSNPTNEDGDFVFELPEVEAFETIWFDPDIATGYTYTTNGEFASVSAPSLASVNDPDGYQLEFMFGAVLQQVFLDAGDTYDFLGNGFSGITEFSITGINLDLGLDPTNAAAFVTGVSFAQGGQFDVVQSPITVFVPDSTDIPEPGTALILGLGLAGLGFSRRRFSK